MSLLTNVQFYTTCQHVFFVEFKPRLPMVMNMGQILLRVPTDPEHCVLIHSCFLRTLVQRSIHVALGIYTGRLKYVHPILTGMIMARIEGLAPLCKQQESHIINGMAKLHPLFFPISSIGFRENLQETMVLVGGLEHFDYFSIIYMYRWDNSNPIDPYFSEG